MLPKRILSGVTRHYPICILFDIPVQPTIPAERQLLRLVLPPWQRPEVWTLAQKTRFIEGVFLGLGTGEYVINGTDYEPDATPMRCSGWLLDGQQRLTAIRDFAGDQVPIFDGIRYSELDRPTQLSRFMNVVFPCHELSYTHDEPLLQEIYDRLNFGGSPHDESQRPHVRALLARIEAVEEEAARGCGAADTLYEERVQRAYAALLDSAPASERPAMEAALKERGFVFVPTWEPEAREGECSLTGISKDCCSCGRHE